MAQILFSCSFTFQPVLKGEAKIIDAQSFQLSYIIYSDITADMKLSDRVRIWHITVERRGARARSFANVAACRAVSNPAWCRIFKEILYFSHLNIEALFRSCVLRQGTLPSHVSLNSGVNEYLVGQRWQCVRLVPSAEMVASAVCSKKGVEMVHEWAGPVTMGNMCEAHRALYVRYIITHHYYYIALVI